MAQEDIGALWQRTSSKGDKFLSGVVKIDDVAHEIVIFKNGFKKAANQPDWRIYKSVKLNPNGTEAPESNDVPF